jgi:hypothetical protein
MSKRGKKIQLCYLSNNKTNDHHSGGQGEHANLQPLTTGIGGF